MIHIQVILKHLIIPQFIAQRKAIVILRKIQKTQTIQDIIKIDIKDLGMAHNPSRCSRIENSTILIIFNKIVRNIGLLYHPQGVTLDKVSRYSKQ